jgi:hypothetical protein
MLAELTLIAAAASGAVLVSVERAALLAGQGSYDDSS